MRSRLLPIALISTAVVMLLAAALITLGGRDDAAASGAGKPTGAARGAIATTSPGRNTLTGAIDAAQVRLRTLPKDDQTWAQLGSAYVQQARVTGDPSYYPKAQG